MTGLYRGTRGGGSSASTSPTSARGASFAGDTAVLAYEVHGELTVDGALVTIDAADSSVWVRRGGRWLCALHTESIAGDPFGRDRAVAA